MDAFLGAGGFLDGIVDGIAPHVGAQRFIDCRPQGRIAGGIGAASLDRYGDFPQQFSENFSAFGVLARFAMLDVSPFTMSSHCFSLRTVKDCHA
jgi:hypothetical protein